MIDHIVATERERLKKLGYETIVTPITEYITDALTTLLLGNDTYILTGIRMSDADMVSDAHTVCFVSPTECLQATEREIAQYGTSLLKLFKDYIIIKTMDENGYTDDVDISGFRLDFIKISPVK